METEVKASYQDKGRQLDDPRLSSSSIEQGDKLKSKSKKYGILQYYSSSSSDDELPSLSVHMSSTASQRKR